MDQAILLSSDPLPGKLAGMISDMTAVVDAQVGVRPAHVKLSVQMPDDSVYEARVDFCPDQCGQISVIQAVTSRLPSAS